MNTPTDRPPCWKPTCRCQGTYNEAAFREGGCLEGHFGPPQPTISEEMQRAVCGLLGYPPPPQGKRAKAMFAGDLSWCRGASEDDWRFVLERAGTKKPQRGEDGSVKEGWVRAVLATAMSRRASGQGEVVANE